MKRLTPREIAVLRLLPSRNKEIARALGVAEGTVKNTLASACRKMGASSRQEAAAIFHRSYDEFGLFLGLPNSGETGSAEPAGRGADVDSSDTNRPPAVPIVRDWIVTWMAACFGLLIAMLVIWAAVHLADDVLKEEKNGLIEDGGRRSSVVGSEPGPGGRG